MNKEIYNFLGKDWIVQLTRKAKIEIEEKMKLEQIKLSNDENFIEIMSNIDQIENMDEELNKIKEIKDKKKRASKETELYKKFLPVAIKMNVGDYDKEIIDPYELLFILITNHPKNNKLSREEFEEGMWELEDKIGLEELEMKVRGLYEKVFMEIEVLNQKVQDFKTKKKEQEVQPS